MQKRFIIEFYKKRGLSLSEKWFQPQDVKKNKEYFEYWRLGPRPATTDPYGYPVGMSKEYIDWEHYQKVFNEFCRHLRFVLPMMFFGTTYIFYRLTQDFAWCEDAVNQAPDVDKRETLINEITKWRPHFREELASVYAKEHKSDSEKRREKKMKEMMEKARGEYERERARAY